MILETRINNLIETLHSIPRVHREPNLVLYILDRPMDILICKKHICMTHLIWTETEQIMLIKQQEQDIVTLKSMKEIEKLSNLSLQKLIEDNVYIPIIRIENKTNKVIVNFNKCKEFFPLCKIGDNFYLKNILIVNFEINFGIYFQANFPTININNFQKDMILIQMDGGKFYFLILRLNENSIIKVFSNKKKKKNK